MFDGLPQKVVCELLFIVINNFNVLMYIKGCPWSFQPQITPMRLSKRSEWGFFLQIVQAVITVDPAVNSLAHKGMQTRL